MTYTNLPNELDPTPHTRRTAAILAVCAAVIWGSAALLTSQDTTTHVVVDSAPATTLATELAPASEPAAGIDQPDQPDQPDPTDPTEPPEPQVPVGGNGDFAPTPTTEPPTCGVQCVAPVDLHPFEVEIGRTPPGIGFANSADGGCSTDCITRAQIFQSEGTTDVAIEVETHTLAFIAVYVDDVEPSVTPNGRPYFPGTQPMVNTHGDLDLSFADTLAGLEVETQYWIIVRATDSDGRSSFVVGSIVT